MNPPFIKWPGAPPNVPGLLFCQLPAGADAISSINNSIRHGVAKSQRISSVEPAPFVVVHLSDENQGLLYDAAVAQVIRHNGLAYFIDYDVLDGEAVGPLRQLARLTVEADALNCRFIRQLITDFING